MVKIDQLGWITFQCKRWIRFKCKSTQKSKTTRAIRLLKEHDTELIALDECHDFMPRSNILPSSKVYRFIKGFMDECGVPFLLIGTNRTEALLEVDEQLRSRFLPTQSLYTFNVNSELEKLRFALVLDSILEQLPRKTQGLNFVQTSISKDGNEEFSLIEKHNNLYRIVLATSGLMRSLMSLLTECLELTCPDEKVTMATLATAYDNVIHSNIGKNPLNPQSMSLSSVKTALRKEGLNNVN